MNNVRNLFGGKRPEPAARTPDPEPEPEFDFEHEHLVLGDLLTDIGHASTPQEVKELVAELAKVVKGWPS